MLLHQPQMPARAVANRRDLHLELGETEDEIAHQPIGVLEVGQSDFSGSGQQAVRHASRRPPMRLGFLESGRAG